MSESTDNYLKTIYALTRTGEGYVSTSALSEKMKTRASSVTDMLKKLDRRGVVVHERYHGVSLTPAGEKEAVEIIRRHRIWEVFLSEKLGFRWDEVHQIAEQLEHISSAELIQRLETFLGNPKYDPHGDPIPDKQGRMPKTQKSVSLDFAEEEQNWKITSVDDSSSELLIHLEKLKIKPGTTLKVKKRHAFDGSLEVHISGKKHSLSQMAASHIMVIKSA